MAVKKEMIVGTKIINEIDSSNIKKTEYAKIKEKCSSRYLLNGSVKVTLGLWLQHIYFIRKIKIGSNETTLFEEFDI